MPRISCSYVGKLSPLFPSPEMQSCFMEYALLGTVQLVILFIMHRLFIFRSSYLHNLSPGPNAIPNHDAVNRYILSRE